MITMRSSAVLATALVLPCLSSCSSGSDETGLVRPQRHPAGAMFRFFQRADAGGTIPENAVWRAKLQRDVVLGSGPLAPGSSGPTDWQWLGPGNVGGRIRAIVIHPTMPSTIWVGSASGGVWKTTDGGQSWRPLDDYPASLVISCMVIDPSDPNRLYLGTGEGYFDSIDGTSNTAAIQGAGMFVTTDGGDHWSQLPSTQNAQWHYVNRLAIDPTDPRILLAATATGIYRTTDAGGSWSRRTSARTFDIQLDPSDRSKLVASRADGVAQYSTDGGLTWTNATGTSGARRIELAYAPSNPSIVYANVTDPNLGILVYRSTDGGRSYSRRTPGNGIQTWSNYNSTIWVDPTDADRIVFAGVRIYHSFDGGQSRSQITNSAHVDFHALVAHPGYDGAGNRILYAGDDGGVHRTSNPFANSPSWTGLNNNLGVTQFYGAAIHPTTGVILGGTQDNGTIRFGGDPQGWTDTFGGDGGYCASDPTDSNVFYGEVQNLRIFRSRDGGRTASYIHNRGRNPIRESSPNFIPHFTLDPNDSNRMLAGGASLWRSNDVRTASSPSWFVIKPALSCGPGPGQGHFQDNPPCNISTIAVAPGNPDVIWVGHNNGHLYKTTNGTAQNPTWTRQDLNSPPLPDRWVSRVAVDPRDNDRVYVALMGYHPNNLWRTLDGGATWAPVSGTAPTALPDIPVPCVAVHPRIDGLLFAGTDLGLFWSYDDGASWQTSSDGPGLVSIDELTWQNDGKLVAITHGRGIYRGDVEPARVDPVGRGCGRGPLPPTLTASPPILGSTQVYSSRQTAANASASLLFAFGRSSPTDLGNGCTLYLPVGGAILGAAGATDASGFVSFGVPIPNNPALVGHQLTAQAFVADPGGPVLGVGELTNAVEICIGF